MSKEKQVEQLSKEKQPTLFREFWEFLKQNKKWWLLPIILMLLGLALLVLLSSSAIAPFIYPLL